MSESDVIWLLFICAVAAIVGANGSSPYGGAHLWAAFTVLGLFAALVQGWDIDWISHLGPLAFAYGAAYVRKSMERGEG
jgi:hypothetical protein